MPQKETPWAAIFDFDGVIVDSEKAHETAWYNVAKNRGLPITREQFLSGFGVKNDLFISDILKWTKDSSIISEIIHEKESLFQAYLKANTLDLIYGIEKWLYTLYQMKIPCAIGSSSIRKNIDICLDKLPIKRYFSVIVSGEEVSIGKPNPEIFLKAAQLLHMDEKKCCVFEDAPLGIEAANSANMKVVAICTTFPKTTLQKNKRIDKIVNNFNDLSYNDVTSWFLV